MNKVDYMCGDIFLVDSNKIGPKIVKFLNRANTWYEHLWRKITGTLDEVRFYHGGMIVDDYVIEQQAIVEQENIYDAFEKKEKWIVWRRKNLTEEQKNKLKEVALADIGKGYDILLMIGKTLRWLTGIPYFERWMEAKEKEFCISRFVSWHYKVYGENFGVKTWHEVTTDIVDDFCQNHPENWEIVNSKGI